MCIVMLEIRKIKYYSPFNMIETTSEFSDKKHLLLCFYLFIYFYYFVMATNYYYYCPRHNFNAA